MNNIIRISEENQKQAWKIINDTNIINIWESVGAKVSLIGSLKLGLMMKHKDIDFHIYTSALNISESFQVMAKFAENPVIKHIEYTNLIDTEEACIEWHAWLDVNGESWKMDMIHILEGSLYDGYMEKVTEGIIRILTPELKQTILQIKYDTPDTENIAGIEYYKAVIGHGVKNYTEFVKWRKENPLSGVVNWMP